MARERENVCLAGEMGKCVEHCRGAPSPLGFGLASHEALKRT